jgi:hypothetical protein
MPTTFEKNQLRKSHRVNLPAKAFMAGGEYPVLDWSLEGFRCSVPNDDLHDDWVGEVTFILPLSGMNVTFDAVARLRRRGESGAGFSFDSINDRSKMLLKTYIQASIEGKLDDIQGIISRVEATEIPMETEKPLTMEERTAFRRSFTGRALVYWVLGIVLFGLILLVLYNNFSRAVSTRGSEDRVDRERDPEHLAKRKALAHGNMHCFRYNEAPGPSHPASRPGPRQEKSSAALTTGGRTSLAWKADSPAPYRGPP